MIDKTNIIDTVCKRLEDMPLGHHLDLRTYKRNRSVVVVKEAEGRFLVLENGYYKERFQVKAGKLRKLLKTLLKKEFPRSRKIRLYMKGTFKEDLEEEENYKRL